MVTSPGARAWRVAVVGDDGSEVMVATAVLSTLHVASAAEPPAAAPLLFISLRESNPE